MKKYIKKVRFLIKNIFLLLFGILVFTVVHSAYGANRDHIVIVGSSTVFPFATSVSERFGRVTQFPLQ